MRLTKMTDYALRLLMYVGAQKDNRLCNISEIATAFDISEAHLMKITHQLALAGFLITVRGKGGGMRLARPAKEINLGDVIRVMETDFHLVECFGNPKRCRISPHCKLAGLLDSALSDFMRRIDQHTLADVLPQSNF